jgi:hypothetical protein
MKQHISLQQVDLYPLSPVQHLNFPTQPGARVPCRCFTCPKWATSPLFLVVQGSSVTEQGKTLCDGSRATWRSQGRDNRHSVQLGAETLPIPPGDPCNHQGKFGKTVRAQQDHSMVYAFFVSTVTARGVTEADG